MRRGRHREALTTTVLLALAAAAAAWPVQCAGAAHRHEAAAYQDLHAAAQRGDLAVIRRLAVSKVAREGRDGAGRTPSHVATFAGQDRTAQALLQAGADDAALEQGGYDAVTKGAGPNGTGAPDGLKQVCQRMMSGDAGRRDLPRPPFRQQHRTSPRWRDQRRHAAPGRDNPEPTQRLLRAAAPQAAPAQPRSSRCSASMPSSRPQNFSPKGVMRYSTRGGVST